MKVPRVFICSGCGKTIYEGNIYYDLLGEQFCSDCINNARKVAVYVPDETYREELLFSKGK